MNRHWNAGGPPARIGKQIGLRAGHPRSWFMAPMRVRSWTWKLSMNLDVAAVRQNAAIPIPASMRRSTETPLRFMAPMRARSWTWKLPMNRSAGLRPGTNLRFATNAPGRETGAPIAVQRFNARIVRGILSPPEGSGEGTAIVSSRQLVNVSS
jgi:hypothetical protein